MHPKGMLNKTGVKNATIGNPPEFFSLTKYRFLLLKWLPFLNLEEIQRLIIMPQKVNTKIPVVAPEIQMIKPQNGLEILPKHHAAPNKNFTDAHKNPPITTPIFIDSSKFTYSP